MWNWSVMGGIPTAMNTRMAKLAGALYEMTRKIEGVVTWNSGDTTPSVSAGRTFKTGNSGATSVTQFDDGRPGQSIIVVFKDANTTLVHGANLQLSGAVNFVGAVGNTRQFVTDDGVIFRQVPLG
jgi:hypothetical protein